METSNTIARPKLETVYLVRVCDTNPDTSFIGELCDGRSIGKDAYDKQGRCWAIERARGEFVHKLRTQVRYQSGRFGEYEYDAQSAGRNEYDYFIAYAGGEKPGSKHYAEYAMQDYERMEGLIRGDWQFIGIRAVAKLAIPMGNYSRLLEETSSGLWGIESDSGNDYLKEVALDELSSLKALLEALNADLSNWDELTSDYDTLEWKDE